MDDKKIHVLFFTKDVRNIKLAANYRAKKIKETNFQLFGTETYNLTESRHPSVF